MSNVLVISSMNYGEGDPVLGEKLMLNYLKALADVENPVELPDHIFLLNSGAKLAIKTSKVLATLESLVAAGVEILVCGTCLDYYEIKDQLAVGEASNIYTLRDLKAKADKLIIIG